MKLTFTKNLRTNCYVFISLFTFLSLIINTKAWAQNPVLASAQVATTHPNRVVLTFDKGNMFATDATGFTVQINAVPVSVTMLYSTSAQGVPDTEVWLDLSSPVKQGQVVTVNYDGLGDAASYNAIPAVDGVLQAFAVAQVVTNNVAAAILNPVASATGVAVGANLSIDFNTGTNLVKGGGGEMITLTPISPTGASIQVPVASGQVTILGDVVTIDPTADLSANTQYEVTFPAGAFLADHVGTDAPLAGVTTSEWRFTTLSVVAITAPNANVCIGGGYTDLSPIVITEGAASSFAIGNDQTLTLSIPVNYSLEAGEGNLTVIGTEISSDNINVATNTITIQYDITGTANVNSIIISGLRIRANSAGDGNIVNNGSGTASQTGNTSGTVHAILTSVIRPAAPVVSNASVSFCQNTNINAQTITATSGANHTWYSDAALSNVISNNSAVNLVTNLGINSANTGTSTVYVTQNNGTCESAATAVTITINPLPIVSLVSSDANNVICVGESITFTAIATPHSGSTNYRFLNGATELQNGTNNTYTSTSLSSGSITVVVTENGCSQTSSAVNLTVNDLPGVSYTDPPAISFPNTQTSEVSLSDGTTFGAFVEGAYVAANVGTYTGAGIVGANFYPDVAGIGDHIITYTYTDGVTGCSNSTTFSLNVFNPNGAIVGLNNRYCLGEPIVTGLMPTSNASIFPNTLFIKRTVRVTLTLTPIGGGSPKTVVRTVRYRAKYNKSTVFNITGTGITGSYPNFSFNPNTVGNRAIIAEVYYTYHDYVVLTNINYPGFNVSIPPPPSGVFPIPSIGKSAVVSVAVEKLPTATLNGISNGTKICTDVTIFTLDPRESGTSVNSNFVIKYRKNGGSVVALAANVKTFNPAALGAGNYQMFVTYKDPSTNCSDDSPGKSFTIHDIPVPAFTFSGGVSTYCENVTKVILLPTDGGSAISGRGVVFEVDQNRTGTYAALAPGKLQINPSSYGVGEHDVRLVYTNANGCRIVTAPQILTVNALPSPNFTFPGSPTNPAYCQNITSVTLTPKDGAADITGADLNKVVFSIDQGAGGTFVNQAAGDVTINPNALGVGTHQIRMTYTNGNGCTKTTTATSIVVHPLPQPNFAESNLVFCANITNSLITLRDGVNNLNAAQFSNAIIEVRKNSSGTFAVLSDGSVTKGASTVTINPHILGTTTPGNPHEIRFIYTDGNNCSATSSILHVTVNPLPQPTFTIAGNKTSYCRDDGRTAITLNDATTGTVLNTNAGGELSRVVFEIDKNQTGTYVNVSGEVSILPTSHQVFLNPVIVGVGTHNLRYRYTNANNCVEISPFITITVNDLPSPVINGIDASGYCKIETNTTLNLQDGGTNIIINTATNNVVFEVDLNQSGTFTAPPAGGITLNNGSNTVTMNPSLFPVGIHGIRYTYTEANTCKATSNSSVNFEVLKLSTLTFTGLSSTYCNDVNSVQLQAFNNGSVLSPPNGAFTLSADNVNFSPSSAIDPSTHIFDPSDLTPGIYWIRYELTSGPNCANRSMSQQVEILFSPSDLDFTFSNTCFGESVTFNATATGITNQWKWNWTFGDDGISKLQNPSHKFPTFATFQVTLVATNQHGCQFTVQKTVTITPVPVADFGMAGFCLGGVTQFTDQSTVAQPGVINQWSWDFGDGNTSNLQNPTHTYASAGTYKVMLRITTAGSCTHQVEKTIYIFSYVIVSSNQNYFENFETSDGGWMPAGDNSSWQHGLPAGNNFDATSGQVWATNLAGIYNTNEQSFVESPCFNIDNMLRPTINIKYWVNTDINFDGAVLLATLDDGANWEVVGAVDAGIEWYNKTGILGNPGNQNASQVSWKGNIIGWAGSTDTTWKVARFSLDALKARLDADPNDDLKTIRFRVAFGSDASTPIGSDLAGFAFDEVLIGERNRVVLLEHFTNSSNADANIENEFVDNFTNSRIPEVVNIQYHTKFPGEDVLNQDNNAAPSARALYYGVAVNPRTVLDGTVKDSVFSIYAQNDYSRRTLEVAPFNIVLDFAGSSPSTLKVQATIKAMATIARPVIVHMVVIEKQIAGIGNTGLTFRNVVKKMLPSAAGTLVNWTTGKSNEVVSQSWEMANIYNNQQVAVVVFVQDDATKEVYQAIMGDPTSFLRTGGNNGNQGITKVAGIADDWAKDFVIYPNPTTTKVYLGYTSYSLKKTSLVTIYSQLGQVIDQKTIIRGNKGIVIDTHHWSKGVYYVEFTGLDGEIIRRKLVKR